MTGLAPKPPWLRRFRAGVGVYRDCVLAEIENAIANAPPEPTAREVFVSLAALPYAAGCFT
jgi:hypothetical protein